MEGKEGGVSNVREGAALVNVCVLVSERGVCVCVWMCERVAKPGEVSHPCGEARGVSYKKKRYALRLIRRADRR